MSECSSVIKPQCNSQQQRTEGLQSKTQQPLEKRRGSFQSRLHSNLQCKHNGSQLSNLVGKQLSSIRTDSQRGGSSRRCGSEVGNHKQSHQTSSGREHSRHDRSEGARGHKNVHHSRGGRGHGHHNDRVGGNKHSHHAQGSNGHNKHHHSGGANGHHRAHTTHHSHGGNAAGGHNSNNTCGNNGGTTVPSTDNGVTLQVKGILQGAYNADTGLMTDALREQNLLPDNQPYAGIGHSGTETISASTLATVGNDAPTDWVLIELRDKNNPDVVVTSQAALIQRDGDVANADTNTTDLHFDVPEGDYFVTLAHRNHLDVTTSKTVSLGGENGTLVDFTDPGTVQGRESTNIHGEAALWAGDANGDNSVVAFGPDNDADAIAATVLTSNGNTNFSFDHSHFGYSNSDVNLDGFTNFNGPDSDKELVNENENNAGGNSTGSENFILQGSTERK